MSLEADRNPSPPPDLLQNYEDLLPDRVGDSVFSKHWLIQILISIVEAVNKEAAEKETSAEIPEKINPVANADVIELDPKLEDDACSLWDMSANKDVANFLHEFKVEDIFLDIIEKTKSPRLLEIAIGILGNMASFDELCQNISENDLLLKSVIPLSGSSDAPTIVQLLRLIHTGIVNESVGDLWLGAIQADSTFMGNVRFMLENSLNGDVLKGALQLLYYILDKEDAICMEWASKDYAKSLITAGNQLLSLSEYESVDELWLLLNLMFQHDEHVSIFATYFEELQPIYHSYITRFGEYEYSFLPQIHRVAAVAASFTTLATLLRSNDVNKDAFKNDDAFLKYIKNMFNSVTEVIEKGAIIERPKESDIESETTVKEGCHSKEQNDESLVPVSSSHDTPCNGTCFSSRGKLTHTVSLHEDDYNSLFILKETLAELCSIILPSVLSVQDDDR